MAKIYPNRVPKNKGEQTVLHCLKRHLDDTFTVIQNYTYEYKKTGFSGKSFGEVDFIIVNNNTGIVFLEVKAGTVCVDEKGFYREDDGGKHVYDEFKNENPFQEADRHMFDVMNLLAILSKKSNRDALKIPYASLAVFPHCNFNDDVRYRNKYMNASHMDNTFEPALMERVEALVPKYKLEKMDSADLEAACNLLIGHVQSSPNLRPLLTAVNARMVELTAEQMGILNNKLVRAIVTGGPGTGKSILAAEKADRLACEGHQVLLLCYNRALAKLLERYSRNKNIIVAAWCEYMDAFVRAIEPGLPTPGNSLEEIARYYHNELPDLFVKQVAAGKGDPWRPTAVVLDEGQDFNMNMLNALAGYFPGIETAPFIVLFDPTQNIFFMGEKAGEWYRKYIQDEHHIGGTYRVAQKIMAYIGTVLPDSYIPPRSFIDDGEVREYFHASATEHNASVEKAINELNKKNIQDNEIMIISFKHLEDSCFVKGVAGKVFVNGKENFALPDELKTNEILYYTVRTSKGLEAMAILLVDLPKKSEIKKNDEYAGWFYIAATRAKYFLYCFYEKE